MNKLGYENKQMHEWDAHHTIFKTNAYEFQSNQPMYKTNTIAQSIHGFILFPTSPLHQLILILPEKQLLLLTTRRDDFWNWCYSFLFSVVHLSSFTSHYFDCLCCALSHVIVRTTNLIPCAMSFTPTYSFFHCPSLFDCAMQRAISFSYRAFSLIFSIKEKRSSDKNVQQNCLRTIKAQLDFDAFAAQPHRDALTTFRFAQYT